MALSEDLVGRSYPPSPAYLVGREKIREFARSIGDESPLSHDVAAAQAAGFADVVAPPTFAFVVSFQAAAVAIQDPTIGIDYSRVVHGEQRFVYSRPIVAGDELVVTTVIESARSVAGNDMLTTKGIITTVDDEHIADAYSTLVARGADE